MSPTTSASAVPAGAVTTTAVSPATTSSWSASSNTTTAKSRSPAPPSCTTSCPLSRRRLVDANAAGDDRAARRHVEQRRDRRRREVGDVAVAVELGFGAATRRDPDGKPVSEHQRAGTTGEQSDVGGLQTATHVAQVERGGREGGSDEAEANRQLDVSPWSPPSGTVSSERSTVAVTVAPPTMTSSTAASAAATAGNQRRWATSARGRPAARHRPVPRRRRWPDRARRTRGSSGRDVQSMVAASSRPADVKASPGPDGGELPATARWPNWLRVVSARGRRRRHRRSGAVVPPSACREDRWRQTRWQR